MRGLDLSRTGWIGALASVLTISLATPPAAAQVRPDSVYELEGVVVTSVRAATTSGGTSALVINPDSLHVVPAANLEQVLRELPFVTVKANSRGQAEINVRGSDSRQVAVLVDGIPLTIGWDHRTDPSLVPLTGAQSITLVRGLHSVLYGPNVLGGVVEVDVSQGPAPLDVPPRVQLAAGFDQFGSRSFSAVGGRSLQLDGGDLRVRAGAGYRSRPGLARPGDVIRPGPGDRDLLTNTDQDQLDGFFALRYHDLGGTWMGLTTSAYRAERGVAPELHVQEPRLWRYPDQSRMLAVLTGGTGQRATPLGEGDLEASVGIDVGSTDIESFGDFAYDEVVETERGEDRTITLRLLGDHSLGRTATLSGAVTYADVHHDEIINGGDPDSYRQRLWSFASEVAVPLSGGTQLSGGVVLDGSDTPESGGKPPLGTLWAWGGRLGASTLALDEQVRLHAAVNRRARFPSLRELYSGALGRFDPNPNLEPEKLLGMEAGATANFGNANLQAVAFHHRLSDAVVRVSLANGMLRRENRHQIRSTGLELLADWRYGGFSLLGDAMLQDVSLIDPDLPGGEGRPEHQPEVRLGLDATAPLPLDLDALLTTKYTGSQYCVHPDFAQNVELEGSWRTDVGLARTWQLGQGALLRNLRAAVSLDNVADAAVYDICGIPQPGRTLRFSIEIG